MLSPASRHPTDLLAGQLDAPYHAWLGWRIAELWRHGQFLTATIPDAFAPIGFDLRLADGLFPGWVTAAGNLATGGQLVLAYNLALAAGLGLDLWAGRALGRVLSTRRWVWFLTGVAFATAPVVLGSAQAHIAFVYAFTVPLLLREAVLIARGDNLGRWGRIAAYLVLAYLCSAYHLVFGTIAFAVVLVAWPRSAVWSRPVLLRLAAAVGVGLLVLSPFVVARVTYERDERAAGSIDVVRTREATAFSADLVGAVTPPDSLWVDLPVPRADLGVQLYAPLRPAFVGYALLAGLVGLCFVRRPARRAFLVATGVLWILSLGPVLHVAGRLYGGDGAAGAAAGAWWMPYSWLQAVPGLGALRAPTRAGYAIAAVLAGALAVSLDALADRLGTGPPVRAAGVAALTPVEVGAVGAGSAPPGPARHRWIPVALVGGVVALLAASLTLPMPTSELGVGAITRAGLEVMAERSSTAAGADGVLIVPWGCRLDDPRIIALQSIHRRPNIGCNPPPTATRWFSGIDAWASSSELAALRCDQGHIDQRPVPFDGSARLGGDPGVERLRRQLGVRYVVIDRGSLPPFGCESVQDAVVTLARYGTVSDDGTWTIVDLDRPPAAP